MAPTFAVLQMLLALQAPGATVTGVVRSAESDQPIGGAIVDLSDLDRRTATDVDGRYLFHEVPAGPQHITVRSIGYEARTLHALVPVSGRLEINIFLVRKPYLLPNVEVRAPIALRGLEADSTNYPDREVSIAAVRNDPMLAEPDGFRAFSGGEVNLDPESPTGVHIRGGSSDQTGYLLDGIPIFNPYHAAGIFAAWNPDALSRLQLSATTPTAAGPDALSGVISATTLAPGPVHRAQGSMSNTQARVTMDGPVGAGISYLLSLRTGFGNLLPHPDEASFLRGGGSDVLAKLDAPLFGGRLLLLGYDNHNEINTAPGGAATLARNLFEWEGRSLGAGWHGGWGNTELKISGWSAESVEESDWTSHLGPVGMAAARRDLGLLVQLGRHATSSQTALGVRLEQSHSSFAVVPDSAGIPGTDLASRLLVATAFVEHTARLAAGLELSVGNGLTAAGTALRASPHAQLRYRPLEPLTLMAGISRQHQFSQSLRNGESVVGFVFPADLYLGAGAAGVPIAQSDQAVLAADYQDGGVRIGLQGYSRYSRNLLLVAPREGEPFSFGDFSTGSATARGIVLNAGVTSSRIGVTGSYGLQQVRFLGGGQQYVPGHGATQVIEAGAIVFPSATASLRLGVTGVLGRRTTIIARGFEWEACNIRDRGCEFAGSPYYGGESLGGTPLPGYFRIDLGARQHWHVELGGRHATVAVFATFTNLLNRKNVLTYARDSEGNLLLIDMRPLSPLVFGVDWSF